MKTKITILCLALFGALFSLAAQEKSWSRTVNIQSIYPDEYEEQKESLCLISGAYAFNNNDKLTFGFKFGLSQGIEKKFANEKIFVLSYQPSMPIKKNNFDFSVSPSLGIGEYHNNAFGINKMFVDLSISVNLKVTRNFYIGMQGSTFIFFSGPNKNYEGLVVGWCL